MHIISIILMYYFWSIYLFEFLTVIAPSFVYLLFCHCLCVLVFYYNFLTSKNLLNANAKPPPHLIAVAKHDAGAFPSWTTLNGGKHIRQTEEGGFNHLACTIRNKTPQTEHCTYDTLWNSRQIVVINFISFH